MKKFIIILIIIIIFFFFWQRIEEHVKDLDDIKVPEIVLEQDLAEKTKEQIIKEVALFNNVEHYSEDLNKDGFLEVLITSLNEDMDKAHFVLIKIINKKGNFEKIGSLLLERNFSGTPIVKETKDINQNNIKELVVDLNTGGVATQTHGILEIKDGLNFVILKKDGETKEAIFLIGASAMHHQVYYLKDKQIIELSARQELEEKMCEVKAYELKNNKFVFSQSLSDGFLEKAGEDCLLEND